MVVEKLYCFGIEGEERAGGQAPVVQTMDRALSS